MSATLRPCIGTPVVPVQLKPGWLQRELADPGIDPETWSIGVRQSFESYRKETGNDRDNG